MAPKKRSNSVVKPAPKNVKTSTKPVEKKSVEKTVNPTKKAKVEDEFEGTMDFDFQENNDESNVAELEVEAEEEQSEEEEEQVSQVAIKPITSKKSIFSTLKTTPAVQPAKKKVKVAKRIDADADEVVTFETESKKQDEQESSTTKTTTGDLEEGDISSEDEIYDWKIKTEEEEAQKKASIVQKDMYFARLCAANERREAERKERILLRQIESKKKRVARKRNLKEFLAIKPAYMPFRD